MYYCEMCGKRFEEPDIENRETYYMGGPDPDGHADVELCPYCHDFEIKLLTDEDEIGWCKVCKYFYEIDDEHGACTLKKPYTVVGAYSDGCENYEEAPDKAQRIEEE